MATKAQQEKTKLFRSKVLWAAHNFGGYITVKNAAKITGYSNRSALVPLRRLAEQRLMIEHKVIANGSKILIFTISKAGRKSVAGESLGQWAQAFNINKFRDDTLNHEMTIQRIVAKLHKGENSDLVFSAPRVIGGIKRKNKIVDGRRPDAMLNQEIAIEIELSMKSESRYREIFNCYNRTNTESIWFVPKKIVHRFDNFIDKLVENESAHLYKVYALCDDDTYQPSSGDLERQERLNAIIYQEEQRSISDEAKRLEDAKKRKQEVIRRTVEIKPVTPIFVEPKEATIILYIWPLLMILGGFLYVTLEYPIPDSILGGIGTFLTSVTILCLLVTEVKRLILKK